MDTIAPTYQVIRQKGSQLINIIELTQGNVTHVITLPFEKVIALIFHLDKEVEAVKDEEQAGSKARLQK